MNQITSNLHQFDIKTIKSVEARRQNIQNNVKLQNWSNYNELHRFDVKTVKNRKTTKGIKLQCIASIWCQNDQNNAKLQNWSNYNELHRFDLKTIKNRKTTKAIKFRSICIDLRSKRSKFWDTSQNYKSDQTITNCIDLTSKRSKLLS